MAALHEFGRQVGMASQIADDVAGIWDDPQVTGMPAACDLAARKKSLPVVAALTSATPAAQHLGWLYRRDDALDQAAFAHTADLVEQAGGRAWAIGAADRELASALTCLDQAAPGADVDGDLRLLADLITCGGY